MTGAELPLGLSAGEIRELARTWDDRGLWNDIVWLGMLAWTADGDQERRLRWHHLVMAVGNFKRQGGRRLHPSQVAPATGLTGAARQNQFRIPGTALTVTRDDPDSWQRLQRSLKGAAVPTLTALLAALWPESHHILDWRVLAAVAGLGIIAGGPSDLGLADPASRDQACLTVANYAKVRTLVTDMAGEHGLPLVAVERALYKLTTTVNGKNKTWTDYGQALLDQLGRTPEAGASDDGPSDDETDLPPSAP